MCAEKQDVPWGALGAPGLSTSEPCPPPDEVVRAAVTAEHTLTPQIPIRRNVSDTNQVMHSNEGFTLFTLNRSGDG